ncbi:CorA family divalent cation transporter [Anaerolentibacter hominis]|uniref:magnesium transporter CorA family protein n=1 Tax=Anaerolentibacter hominis TaxID=3079009 RepID=UPI0031B87D7A
MFKILPFSRMDEAVSLMKPKVFHYIHACEAESFESFDDFNLLAFNYYNVHGNEIDTPKIIIYMDRDYLLFFCESDLVTQTVTTAAEDIQEAGSLENGLFLYRFFSRLLKGDMDSLERFEQTLNDEESRLLESGTPDTPKHFALWRKELLRRKRYYEQLNTIFDEMAANDNQLLSDIAVRRLTVLKSRTDRYLNAVRDLQEMVMQMREAYQSQLAIHQNDLMKIFTIVTVIFLPLTLIAGWYGMNFVGMPELRWEYGYPVVIGISILIVGVMVWFFKRKKWF